ncbi:MAG: HIT family protein [Chloroflexi bacterium]|nr:HIT family protein [Chloroflexota bacterium]
MDNLTPPKHCRTCELIARRDTGTAPMWDNILRTPFWDVVHSYNTSLPGWLVLVARRHIEAIDALTEDEAVELGQLLRRVSIALREVTGCVKTYVIQFAEQAEHPHVHFHLVPRMADQPEDRRGGQVFGYLGVAEKDRVPEETLTALAAQIQSILLTGP